MSTPMFQQYEAIKAQHRDAILLFRLGDFYEMFGPDAQEGSRLLGLTLTRRQERPMCGVPHHAAKTYIHRLLKLGRKVAVVEQTSAPDGKNLTRREVVEILSPGAVYDLDYLDPHETNYILAIGQEGETLACAWSDVSTGELNLGTVDCGEDREAAVRGELARLNPRELLVQESLLEQSSVLGQLSSTSTVVNRIPDWVFDRRQSLRRLTELLNVQNLRGFGIDDEDPALLAAAVLLDYLEENARHSLTHLTAVRRHRGDQTVLLDDATIRNLELVRNMHDGGTSYSLLEVLDQCRTAMGSRLLRRWVLTPSRSTTLINQRLDRVEELYHDQPRLQGLRADLDQAYDLERLIGRLGVEKAHPKDLVGIAATVRAAQRVAEHVGPWFGPGRSLLEDDAVWEAVQRVGQRITETLMDEPAVALNEGGIIRVGVDRELDHYRGLRDSSRQVLNEYLEEQRRDTGVTSLKIKYNRVLGHFFEVPRSQAERLPEDFIRRQSLANADRFTTTRLASLEDEINTAGESADRREQELYLALRGSVAEHMDGLSRLAQRIAEVDVLANFAQVATLHGYRRPEIEPDPLLEIRGGRHPVVEHHLPPGEFVDNDVVLSPEEIQFLLITGPNMAGKSTVLRQTALIALMAHIGCFVPAERARIGIMDRIFCRVGASDNIARGESTFLVEMNETSNILRNAGVQSLVIMDEVGRGTSTHDGLSIAWAVSEWLLERGCRTLFATHYHELTELSGKGFGAKGMAVEHTKDRIVFLKKLRDGAGDRSYGVDVARMAGLPEAVIQRARQLLSGFEGPGSHNNPAPPEDQDLFPSSELFSSELRSLDLDGLSPREALDILYRWRSRIDPD